VKDGKARCRDTKRSPRTSWRNTIPLALLTRIGKGGLLTKSSLLQRPTCSTLWVALLLTLIRDSPGNSKILDAAGTPFMLLPDEWCCGNMLYSVGWLTKRENWLSTMLTRSGKPAQTPCWSVAPRATECGRLTTQATQYINRRSGFKVVHLTEYVDKLVKQGALKLAHQIDLRLTYHDPCSLSRLSEPWVPWEGERGLWGVVNPPLERRRGTNGFISRHGMF